MAKINNISPQVEQPATFKPLGTVYRWTALKDGKLIYQYSDVGFPQLFAKTAIKLPDGPEPHPAIKPDMLVNGGALKLALNSLRRGTPSQIEIADELEKTAQPAQEPLTPHEIGEFAGTYEIHCSIW